MILEAAILQVRAGMSAEFERAFHHVQHIIAATPGYHGHELQRCLEAPDRYLLLVRWRSVEDHVTGFRGSSGYQQWKEALHHFYDPFPTVEHFEFVTGAQAVSRPE